MATVAMPRRYEGKVCLVTAATAGIGLAIATRMAQEGGRVIICSRKKQNVDTAVASIQSSITAAGSTGSIEGVVVNVGAKDQRALLVKLIEEKYGGKLDVLVPNAACSTHFGSQMEISERAYDKMWDLNVKSTFFLIKECIELIRAAGEGANICITSSVTGQNPTWTIGVYGSTKAALENMIKWMKDELRADGIRVNGIAPGLIKTEFSGPLWNNDAVPPESIGLPEQIASVTATICSADGAFMNGDTYQVHGGFPKI